MDRVLMVALCLIALVGENEPASNPEIQIPYIISSTEQSNRTYACPMESVSFSCAVHGPQLIWRIDEDVVAFFNANDSIGTGFVSSDTCFLYSAVINDIQLDNNGSYIRYSTLTITPGNLDNSLILIQPCNLTNVSSIISCTARSDILREPWSTTYNIAGIPTVPGPQAGTTCSFTTSAVRVAIASPTIVNTDLAYYKVEVITDGSIRGTMTVMAMATNQYDKNGTKFNMLNNFDTTRTASVQGRVTAIDKCGQQSMIPLVINCTAMGSAAAQVKVAIPLVAISFDITIIYMYLFAYNTIIL